MKVGHGLTLSVKGQGLQLEYANGCYTYTVNGTTRHQRAQGGDRYLPQMKALLPQPLGGGTSTFFGGGPATEVSG